MKTQIKMSLCLCLSGAFLTACGGGSGDSDNDGGGVIQDAVFPLNEVVDMGGTNPLMPEPVIPEPVMPEPSNLGSAELSKLLGRTLFTHRFVPNGTTTYIYDVNFNSAGFSTNGDGLEGVGISVFQVDGTEGFTQDGDVVVGCAATNMDLLCIQFFDDGDRDYFIFPFLADGSSSGNYEFCTADRVELGLCIDDLLTNPDGIVLVSNIAPGFASLDADSRSIVNYSETDSLNYRRYEKQSSPSNGDTVQTRQDTDSEEYKSRSAALKALTFER